MLPLGRTRWVGHVLHVRTEGEGETAMVGDARIIDGAADRELRGC